MLEETQILRPYGNQTLVFPSEEERADIKHQRIQKPLPSQAIFPI